MSDAGDNAVGLFNAIFPSQQEGKSSYKSCFSCYFCQSVNKNTKAAVIKSNVALATPPSQKEYNKIRKSPEMSSDDGRKYGRTAIWALTFFTILSWGHQTKL